MPLVGRRPHRVGHDNGPQARHRQGRVPPQVGKGPGGQVDPDGPRRGVQGRDRRLQVGGEPQHRPVGVGRRAGGAAQAHGLAARRAGDRHHGRVGRRGRRVLVKRKLDRPRRHVQDRQGRLDAVVRVVQVEAPQEAPRVAAGVKEQRQGVAYRAGARGAERVGLYRHGHALGGHRRGAAGQVGERAGRDVGVRPRRRCRCRRCRVRIRPSAGSGQRSRQGRHLPLRERQRHGVASAQPVCALAQEAQSQIEVRALAVKDRPRLGPDQRHGVGARYHYGHQRQIRPGRVHRLVEPERGRAVRHVEGLDGRGAGDSGMRLRVDDVKAVRRRPGYPVAGEVGDRAVAEGERHAAARMPCDVVALPVRELDRKGRAVLGRGHLRPGQVHDDARPVRKGHQPRVHLRDVDVLVQRNGEQAVRDVDHRRAGEVGPPPVRLHVECDPARLPHGVSRQVRDRPGADVESQAAGGGARLDRPCVLGRGERDYQGRAVGRRRGRPRQRHARLPAEALDVKERRVGGRRVDRLAEHDRQLAASRVQGRADGGRQGRRVVVGRHRQGQAGHAGVRDAAPRAAERRVPDVEQRGRGAFSGEGRGGGVPLGPCEGHLDPGAALPRRRPHVRAAERHPPLAGPDHDGRRVGRRNVHGLVERERERPAREVQRRLGVRGAGEKQRRDAERVDGERRRGGQQGVARHVGERARPGVHLDPGAPAAGRRPLVVLGDLGPLRRRERQRNAPPVRRRVDGGAAQVHRQAALPVQRRRHVQPPGCGRRGVHRLVERQRQPAAGQVQRLRGGRVERRAGRVANHLEAVARRPRERVPRVVKERARRNVDRERRLRGGPGRGRHVARREGHVQHPAARIGRGGAGERDRHAARPPHYNAGQVAGRAGRVHGRVEPDSQHAGRHVEPGRPLEARRREVGPQRDRGELRVEQRAVAGQVGRKLPVRRGEHPARPRAEHLARQVAAELRNVRAAQYHSRHPALLLRRQVQAHVVDRAAACHDPGRALPVLIVAAVAVALCGAARRGRAAQPDLLDLPEPVVVADRQVAGGHRLDVQRLVELEVHVAPVEVQVRGAPLLKVRRLAVVQDHGRLARPGARRHPVAARVERVELVPVHLHPPRGVLAHGVPAEHHRDVLARAALYVVPRPVCARPLKRPPPVRHVPVLVAGIAVYGNAPVPAVAEPDVPRLVKVQRGPVRPRDPVVAAAIVRRRGRREQQGGQGAGKGGALPSVPARQPRSGAAASVAAAAAARRRGAAATGRRQGGQGDDGQDGRAACETSGEAAAPPGEAPRSRTRTLVPRRARARRRSRPPHETRSAAGQALIKQCGIPCAAAPVRQGGARSPNGVGPLRAARKERRRGRRARLARMPRAGRAWRRGMDEHPIQGERAASSASGAAAKSRAGKGRPSIARQAARRGAMQSRRAAAKGACA